MTPADLGIRVGASEREVIAWETSAAVPTTDQFLALLSIFGVALRVLTAERR